VYKVIELYVYSEVTIGHYPRQVLPLHLAPICIT
jgi:hypothetical protein